MMTKEEAIALYRCGQEATVKKLLELDARVEQLQKTLKIPDPENNPLTPSGMTPVYLKPAKHKRKQRPGRKKGHKGTARTRPETVDHFKEHTLDQCPGCQTPLKKPVKVYQRYIEDIPPIQKPEVTEHTVFGYWCSRCKKVVFPTITDALPNAMIGLRLVVFTAWLHYLVGVSVHNLVKILSVFSRFTISTGGLTHAWKNLALVLEPRYREIGQKISQSAVLSADETGWRLNGITHWLWCFTTHKLCYYIITRSRGSPVVKNVLGTLFKGILICDFWGAYNKISALAKQRCFYHLFTELAKVDKHNACAEWKTFRKKLSRLLKDGIRLSRRKGHIQSEAFERLTKRMYHRLDQFLETDYQTKDTKRLIKRLKRHKDELFTFLEYEGVSPYNNHAEQQMRKPVLTRKVSQQNRSEQGAKTQAVLMTLFRCAELQGKNPVETLLSMARAAIGNDLISEHLDFAA